MTLKALESLKDHSVACGQVPARGLIPWPRLHVDLFHGLACLLRRLGKGVLAPAPAAAHILICKPVSSLPADITVSSGMMC